MSRPPIVAESNDRTVGVATRGTGTKAVASLATPWSTSMGMSVPLVNAPMGGVAGGQLASAVTEAGGLGMIGVGSAGSVDLLEEEAAYPQTGGLPFGIGLLDWALHRDPGLLHAAIGASPALISVSFGETWDWVEPVRDSGIVTAAQICCVESARSARDAGIDVLVARGAEGGGHGNPVLGTLPLLESVLGAVSLPVLAAGGISTERGVAAVLAAGASGAWLGTAFASCPESLASEVTRSALVEAEGTDTVMTRLFDIALEYPWPSEYPERILRDAIWERWRGQEEQLKTDREAASEFVAAYRAEGHGAVHVNAGQGVGAVTRVRTASEVVSQLSAGALDLLGRWSHAVAPG